MQRRNVIVILGAAAAGALVALAPGWSAAGSQEMASAMDLDKGLLAALPLIFLAGILTSATPCVYPLIPITVSIFGARGAGSRTRGAALSGTYVLGIAAMFSSLGVAAALSGKAFGQVLGNPWVVAGLAAFFAAMAASMFGAFELQLPPALATRVASARGAGFAWAFAMGLLAGVVAAPCTGPVLAAVLTFVANTRSPVAGFWLLFVYALGVGLPFFVLGTFSISLPKGGPWMDTVKSVFGIALLGAAIWFARPFLPALKLPASALMLAVIAGGIVATGILLGAVHRTFYGPRAERLLKAAGIAAVLAGFAVRMMAVPSAEASTGAVRWVHAHDEALAAARSDGKPVLVDFYADWCAGCVELDKHVFTDARVQREAERFVMLKIDATHPSDATDALHEKYGVNSMPIVLFLASDGKVREEPKVVGYVPPDEFLAAMRKVP